MQFSNVIGQERLKNKLIEGVKTNRVHHAQLFLGDSGYGSLALAMAYAQYLNCESPTDTDSCGECANCLKNYKLIHPDVHFSFPVVATKSSAKSDQQNFYAKWRELVQETAYPSYNEWILKIGKENKQGNIPMSEARNIIRKLTLKSHQGGYKVLIMWLPEYLGREGNVLLKVLEEPSPKTIFILVAEDESKILQTILSRCQIIRIPRIESEEIKESLIKGLDITEERAGQCAALAEGSFRRAIEIFNAGDNHFYTAFTQWVRLAFMHDYSALHLWAQQTAGTGRESTKNFLIYALGMFRESILLGQDIEQLSSLQGEEFTWMRDKFAPAVCHDGVIKVVGEINETLYLIERNVSLKVVLFDLSLHISKHLRKSEVSPT